MNPWELWLTLPLALAWLYLARGHGRFWDPGPALTASGAPPERWPSFRQGSRTGMRQKRWPSVCVVVPARNEAQTLPRSLPSLLKQDYAGPFRVLLVDDASSDGTGDLARALAAEFPGTVLSVLAGTPLAPGWTGKLWALEQGLRFAEKSVPGEKPEWFLFTDADILHPEDQVRKLVLEAESGGLDMVSLMVKLRCESFWERLLIPSFVFFFQKLYPFSRVNDPGSRTAAAAGGCILVRSAVLEKAGGLEAVRSQLIDDCALARRVKDAGGRIRIGLTENTFSLREYDTLGSIWTMVARTAFTQLGGSWAAVAGTVLGMSWLYGWAPLLLVSGLAGGNMERTLWGAGLWLVPAMLYLPTVRSYGVSAVWSFSLPLISLLYCGMTLDSAWRGARGSGGLWKGRSYPN